MVGFEPTLEDEYWFLVALTTRPICFCLAINITYSLLSSLQNFEKIDSTSVFFKYYKTEILIEI